MILSSLQNDNEVSSNITKNDYKTYNSFDPIKNEEWTPIPDKLAHRIETQYSLIHSRKLKTVYRYSAKEVAVYGMITRYLGKSRKQIPYPKISQIAARTPCSYNTARNAIAKFEEDLVIYTSRNAYGKQYYFVPIKSDGFPNETSGEYQFAKAILEQNERKKEERKNKKISLKTHKDCRSIVQKNVDLMYKNCISQTLEKQPKIEPEKSSRAIVKSSIDTPLSPHQNQAAPPIYIKQDNKTNVKNNSGTAPDPPPKKEPNQVSPNGLERSKNISEDVQKIRAELGSIISRQISTLKILTGINKTSLVFMLWLAGYCKNDGVNNPVGAFCGGIENEKLFKAFNRNHSRSCEAEALKEQNERKDDSRRLSIEYEKIDKKIPEIISEDIPFEKKREAFLDSIKDEYLLDLYKKKTEDQLQADNSFKNFCDKKLNQSQNINLRNIFKDL